jgi:hypothetical protein
MYDAAVTLHPTGGLCFRPNPTASKYGDVPGRCNNGSNLYPWECSCTPIGDCCCGCEEKNDGRARAGVASRKVANIVFEDNGEMKNTGFRKDLTHNQLPEVLKKVGATIVFVKQGA